jgi:vitamin B12 transporter
MKRSCYVATLAMFSPIALYAQVEDMAQMVVTASRTAQSENESLVSVTVITREDLQRLQAQSLQDALRGIPGLTLSNSGGAGKATSLFIRGAEADHALVLIDGMKLGSATLGTAPLEHIPIAQIERIEIVRGPRSSLYGSEAIGGVVQIFTRRGGGDFSSRFDLDLGSDDYRGGSFGLSGGGEQGWYSIDLALSDTEGFDARRGNNSGSSTTDEPDKDGYRNESATLRAGYRFDNGLEVDFHALNADGENEYDGNRSNESESRQQVLGTNLRYSPADSWLLTLAAGNTRDETDHFEDGIYMTTYDTERDMLSLQSDLDLGIEQLLSLGIDYEQEEVDGTTEYSINKRDNRGYFLQYQGDISAQSLQLSLRQDDHESFGKHTTGGIAWGYGFNGVLKVWASYATAFKAPTFNELYYPNWGNPDLKPEESASVEFGLQGEAGWGSWSISTYQTKVDELIGYDASSQKPSNIDQVLIRGVEAQVSASIGQWQSATSLTLLDPKNDSGGDDDGNLLPRRSRQSLRFDLDREFGAYGLGLSFLAEGKRYYDLANTQKLGGFGTMDLRASYRINSDWRIQGRLENLFDKTYETAKFYNQPGRSFYLKLSYQS